MISVLRAFNLSVSFLCMWIFSFTIFVFILIHFSWKLRLGLCATHLLVLDFSAHIFIMSIVSLMNFHVPKNVWCDNADLLFKTDTFIGRFIRRAPSVEKSY